MAPQINHHVMIGNNTWQILDKCEIQEGSNNKTISHECLSSDTHIELVNWEIQEWDIPCHLQMWPFLILYIVVCQGSGASIKATAQHTDKRYPCPLAR